jgi:hypothetical protein
MSRAEGVKPGRSDAVGSCGRSNPEAASLFRSTVAMKEAAWARRATDVCVGTLAGGCECMRVQAASLQVWACYVGCY